MRHASRRLAEAGVRSIQINYGDNTDNPAWDQHSNLPKHADHALAVDRPVAGLLTDLKRRGLLEDTLVWFGGEFCRTPYAERHGTPYQVQEAKPVQRRGLSYADNFSFNRRAPWTH